MRNSMISKSPEEVTGRRACKRLSDMSYVETEIIRKEYQNIDLEDSAYGSPVQRRESMHK